jgi:hypothetical protein
LHFFHVFSDRDRQVQESLAHTDCVEAYLQRIQQQQEAAYQQSQQQPSVLMHSLRERVARLRQERRSGAPVAAAKS